MKNGNVSALFSAIIHSLCLFIGAGTPIFTGTPLSGTVLPDNSKMHYYVREMPSLWQTDEQKVDYGFRELSTQWRAGNLRIRYGQRDYSGAQPKNTLSFWIYNERGDVVGSWKLDSGDESIHYSMWSYACLRRADDYDYVKYIDLGSSGILVQKVHNTNEDSICQISDIYWEKITELVKDWKNTAKFVSEEKSRYFAR